jgi:hypothetical protein
VFTGASRATQIRHITCNHFYATIATFPSRWAVLRLLNTPAIYFTNQGHCHCSINKCYPVRIIPPMEPLWPEHRNLESEGHLSCPCGRSFLQHSALSKHQKSCQRSKKRLSFALGKAKEIWTGRKRPRLGDPGQEPPTHTTPLPAGLTPAPTELHQDIADYEVCPYVL